MSLLPKLKQTDKTWHGIDGRFSSHYSKRFYHDGSLSKAQKNLDQRSTFFIKEKFYNDEIDKIQKNRFVLLNINQEKEKFEKIKKKVMAEKRAIGKKIKQAAIKIQKHIRGYLCRKKHEPEMEDLKKAKLGISVKAMNRYVGKCCIYLADNIVEASIVIQKHMRRFLAQKLLKRLKVEDRAARKITNFFKILRNRSKFKKSLQNLKIKKKLKEIKHRLRWIKFKSWWKVNRTRFTVIRLITRSRNSSVHRKSSSRASRKHSVDSIKSRKSRKSFAVSQTFPPNEIVSKQMTSPGEARIEFENNLEAPGKSFERIEEVANEESMSLTLNQFNFEQIMKQSTIRNRRQEGMDIDGDMDDQALDEENEFGSGRESAYNRVDEEIMRSGSGSISESIEPFISETSSEGRSYESNQEADDDLDDGEGSLMKEKKPVKVEEPPEKPIPSYRKPTAAFNSWKKRPPSPEQPPKEIHPPPKHLLVWTRCRRIYKTQTKRHKSDLKYQTAGGKHKRPVWKPPLTANEQIPSRKLPKLLKKSVKIPEFLEPYTFIVTSDTPDSPIKLNQEQDSDSYEVDSDTSFEYEAGDFRSTGLSVALPQLYSIVKSYGKNADAIVK